MILWVYRQVPNKQYAKSSNEDFRDYILITLGERLGIDNCRLMLEKHFRHLQHPLLPGNAVRDTGGIGELLEVL
jgi:hypothetical protein